MKNKKIYRISDRKKLVKLLNAYFTDLNMGKDASVFGNVVKSDVKEAFTALIPE